MLIDIQNTQVVVYNLEFFPTFVPRQTSADLMTRRPDVDVLLIYVHINFTCIYICRLAVFTSYAYTQTYL